LANWLADINFRDIQAENSSKRAHKTGYWVLEKGIFKTWVRGDKEGPRILWGTGMPGAGKTVIASLVIEHLEAISEDRKDICVLFAYCRYTEPIPVKTILAALLRQLLEGYDSVYPFVKALYYRHHLKKTQPSQDELLNILQKVAASGIFKSSFYALDGLDEASSAVQFDLLEVLASIPAHFFLTSRPLDSMKDQVSDAVFFHIAASDADIALLVERNVERISGLRRLFRQNETLRAEVVDRILERSSGMFLLASLQLDMLRNSECASIWDLRQSLAQLPVGIEAMYEATMKRIESHPKAYLAKLVLTWLVCAQWSLPVNALRYAVAVDPETYHFDAERLVDDDFLLSLCCGLVTAERSSGHDDMRKFRLVHFTARDYLESHLTSYWSCTPHSIIASACVSRLLQSGFHDFDYRKYGCSSVDYAIYTAYSQDNMLLYCHSNWVTHATQCKPLPKAVCDFVGQCKKYPIHHWRHAKYDLLSGIHVAATYGLEECFPLVLDLGAGGQDMDTNACTEGGASPLILAIKFKQIKVADTLLSFSTVDVNIHDSSGRTALMYASWLGLHDIAHRLLAFEGVEVNPNAKTNEGDTALILAADEGRESIVSLLCKSRGVDVNIINQDGRTALALAAYHGRVEIVKTLLDAPGVDVNAGEKSPLERATKGGHREIVRMLLRAPDIDVNRVSSNGHTSLSRAAWMGNLGIVEELLRHPTIDVNGGEAK
ncbi:ankyrin, partial [Coprinopsis marcescibilis]